MTRNLKILGLALAAVFAMSAIAASAAMAVEFHSEIETTTLKGEQTTQNIFHAGGTEVKCNKAEFTGTAKGTKTETNKFTTSSVTVHPTYSSCTAFGFTTDINTAPCNYVFENLGGSNPTYTAQVTVECETGKSISLTPTFLGSSVCTVTIGAQTGITGGVDFTNGGTEKTRDVLVTSTAAGIVYTVSGGGGICGSVGVHSDGAYTGTVTEKGFEGATQRGIWVS